MIISAVAAKYGISKMCGFYWATLYKPREAAVPASEIWRPNAA